MRKIRNDSKNREAWRVNGVLRREYIRCGKRSCHCVTGRGHKAYYLYWHNTRRTVKRYVKRQDLDVIRASLKRGHAFIDRQRQARQERIQALKASMSVLRMCERGYSLPDEVVIQACENIRQSFDGTRVYNSGYWYITHKDHLTALKGASFMLDLLFRQDGI